MHERRDSPEEVAAMRRTSCCERCGQATSAWIVSFFTEEAICMACLEREREVMGHLRERGVSPGTLAGCGYMPPARRVPRVPGLPVPQSPRPSVG